MTQHIMVDLETMGTRPNAAIMSIGACVFDPHVNGRVGTTFYQNVRLQSCLDVGLTVDGDTIDFWMDQPDEARSALKIDRVHIVKALQSFTGFVETAITHTGEDFRIWAHGANFDIVLLESAYHACCVKRPWKYNVMRDDRTLFELAGVDLKDFNEGTLHNAMHDACNQAAAVQESYRRLKIK